MEFERDPNNFSGDILNSAKEELELLYEEKVKGIIIRARARWHEHGEKSTKYFLNLEKRNHMKNKSVVQLLQTPSIYCPNNKAFIMGCTRV